MAEIELEGEQTIFQVSATYQRLRAALATHQVLYIELRGVHECDTAFVQLILWLQLEAERLQQQVHLRNPPRQLQELAALLGLTQAIKLPELDHA